MNAEPLNKEIYDAAVKMGITKITLNFSGGSDQGHLDVDLGKYSDTVEYRDLESKVETWAWDAYEYSGAGDGSDYGDDIEYDLVNKKVMTSEWFTARQEGEYGEKELTFVDGE